MAPEIIPASADLDRLRHELARRGVSLFERTPVDRGLSPSVADLAALVVALAESGDARLEASIPCLLASAAGAASRDVIARAASERPTFRAHLGWVYRLTRALVTSRRPILERSFGPMPGWMPSEFEPNDLPDPGELAGEMTLWRASERSRERNEPDAAGAAIRLFDRWIRLRHDELPATHA